jgi:hypothetical protein
MSLVKLLKIRIYYIYSPAFIFSIYFNHENISRTRCYPDLLHFVADITPFLVSSRTPDRKAPHTSGKCAFVVQERLGNPDGVVRYHSRDIVKQWGCSIQVITPSKPDKAPRVLYKNPKAAILDMNISYDAKILFFSMREGQDDKQIAAVLNYIGANRNGWKKGIDPSFVSNIRSDIRDRKQPYTDEELRQRIRNYEL